MEASRFGFGGSLPPSYKFDPTDADIVARYLLPRALGLPNEFGHAVIDDDPCSCPPWELLARHGHAGSAHAFFFGPPRPPDPSKRASRGVAAAAEKGEDDDASTSGGGGGKWAGQNSETRRLDLVRGGGCAAKGAGAPTVTITYKRQNLSYRRDEEATTSGWVMHDFQIIAPPQLSGTVLSRVKLSDRPGTRPGGAGAGDASRPAPSLGGVSSRDRTSQARAAKSSRATVRAAGDALVPSDGAGTSSGAQAELAPAVR